MKYDVVGLGHCAVDYLSLVPYYPELDEKIKIDKLIKQGGGPAANAVVTLSRLGASTVFIGRVGDDEEGKYIIKEFKKEGVDIKGIITERGTSSLFAFCVIEKKTGKRTIFWNKGSRSEIDVKSLNTDIILSGKILYLDSHEINLSICAARLAKENNIKIVLDPDFYYPKIDELISLTDVLITPLSFAQNFTAESDYNKAAEKLLPCGPETIVVTLGEKGCLYKSKNMTFTQKAFKMEIVDTTGAGDAFHGAFVYGLLKGWNPEITAEFASAVAAMKCNELGARAGIPGLKEVKQFLKHRDQGRDKEGREK